MGLFGSIAKIAGSVIGGKGLVGSIAKTVVGSVPILGGAISAVGAVKSAIRPPTIANTANLSARTGVPGFGQPGLMASTTKVPRALRRGRTKKRRRAAAPRKAKHRRTRKHGGVSAKQRAARARFARAAKRGRIKKGSHL